MAATLKDRVPELWNESRLIVTALSDRYYAARSASVC